jgi:pimeloyl-ACP methyl ester carboxylesterase
MAPTVVALHGISSNGRAWDAVARELGDNVRLVTPDLRGRGDSGGQPGPYGLARHVQDVVALLDAEGLDRSVVVGHSMGAYVTALLAVTHPDRLDSVVLVDGGPPLPVPDGADPDALLEATLGPSIERLSKEFPDREAYHDFWRAHPAFAGYDVRDEDLTRYADHDLRGDPPHLRSSVAEEAVRTDGRELIADHDVRTALETMRVPGVLLRAQRGLLDQPEAFIPAELAAGFDHPTVTLQEVDDTNHFTILMGAAGAREVARAIRSRL